MSINWPTQPQHIHIRRLDHARDLDLPAYASIGAAGMDLVAAIAENVVLAPGQRALIPTGISLALPVGYEAQVRPRSGLALRNGITTLNTPGTIDSDYRGEVGEILINHGDEDFVVERGMRIAQMVVAIYTAVTWVEVNELPTTERGAGGFGSTGVQHPTEWPREKASDK